MNSGATDYDLILAGGGLANSLIAWRLRSTRPELRILLLEADAHIGGNHTWSFHDSDLAPAEHEWIAPLVSHRWHGYNVVFPEHARSLAGGYASIASNDFAAVIEPALAGALATGVHIDGITPTSVVLRGGETLSALAVIDGRGVRASSHLALGYQNFLGQEVRLREPHGLASPIIMDASVEQQGGYRFVYVLPFDAERLLIEDTHYVDSPTLEPERLRANIAAYARTRGWRIAELLREETGSLPIVLAGDIDAFWRDAGSQPCSGLRAGLFHHTTGYSLPHAVRLAGRIADLAAQSDFSSRSVFAAIRADAMAEWRAQRFFRLLNRMLFLAGRPDERWRVMQRFYRLPAPLIAAFYAGRLHLGHKARILAGKPPVPVLQALAAARKTHPSQIHRHPLQMQMQPQQIRNAE